MAILCPTWYVVANDTFHLGAMATRMYADVENVNSGSAVPPRYSALESRRRSAIGYPSTSAPSSNTNQLVSTVERLMVNPLSIVTVTCLEASVSLIRREKKNSSRGPPSGDQTNRPVSESLDAGAMSFAITAALRLPEYVIDRSRSANPEYFAFSDNSPLRLNTGRPNSVRCPRTVDLRLNSSISERRTNSACTSASVRSYAPSSFRSGEKSQPKVWKDSPSNRASAA